VASVTCPECHHRFRLPATAKAGDDLTCPECDAEFEVGEIPSAPPKRLRKPEPEDEPEEEEEERPRRRRAKRPRRRSSSRAGSRSGMLMVSTGFKLVYYGLLLMVLAVIVAVVAMVFGGGALAAGGRAAGAGLGLAGVLLIGSNVLSLVGAVLGLIGLFMCLAVPSDTGNAKALIMVSIGLLVAAVAVSVAGMAGAQLIPAGGFQAAFGLTFLLGILSEIVFLLFCKALALYLDRRDLADLAMTILWLMLINFLLGVGMVVAAVAGAAVGLAGGGGAGIGIGMVLGCALWLLSIVLGIIALVKFIHLTRDMSEACERFADRGSGRDEPVW
jgi:hypothetical protein